MAKPKKPKSLKMPASVVAALKVIDLTPEPKQIIELEKSLGVKLEDDQITKAVDALGILMAALAPEIEKMEGLKALLKTQGNKRYEGTLYEALVYDRWQSKLNMEAVRNKLSAQFIRANSKDVASKCIDVNAKSQDKSVSTDAVADASVAEAAA